MLSEAKSTCGDMFVIGASVRLLTSLPADRRHLVEQLLRYADDCSAAWQQAEAFALPSHWRRPRRVVALGVGGSGVGAEIAQALTRAHSGIAVETWRGDGTPIVDAETLVIASSYSGNTAEVLDPFRSLVAAGSPGMLLAISSDGALSALAGEHEVPLFHVQHAGPPRFAFPYTVLPLVSVLHRLGALHASYEEPLAERLLVASQAWSAEGDSDNIARRIALDFDEHLPVIIGSGLLRPVARRWQAQINENAKRLSIAAELPEAAHNLVEALVDQRPTPRVIVLADDEEADHFGSHLREDGYPVETLNFRGDPLDRVLTASLLGDWVSIYLAALRDADITTTPAIDMLRMRHGTPPQGAGGVQIAAALEPLGVHGPFDA